jgi:hypothetical protein
VSHVDAELETPVIITKITRQNAAEVHLIEDDDVVKTLE